MQSQTLQHSSYRSNVMGCVSKQQVCIQSVTVVLDEDVSRQITLTREGDVIIGVNPAPVLPYEDGRNFETLHNTSPILLFVL